MLGRTHLILFLNLLSIIFIHFNHLILNLILILNQLSTLGHTVNMFLCGGIFSPSFVKEIAHFQDLLISQAFDGLSCHLKSSVMSLKLKVLAGDDDDSRWRDNDDSDYRLSLNDNVMIDLKRLYHNSQCGRCCQRFLYCKLISISLSQPCFDGMAM